MDTVRLRIEFEDRHILSKSQRSERLKRSWLLLKPLLQETISDLSSYLLEIFGLYHSCPNGLILSMDGFVLPPFESTCILKDKDIISVRRKGELLYEIEEKQRVLANVPLLANEEFEKETGGYQSEHEEDEDNQSEHELHLENSHVSRKRKASKKLQSSKKKIKRHKDPQYVGNGFHTEQREGPEGSEQHPGKSTEKKKKKEKESGVKNKINAESTPSTDEANDDMLEHTPSLKRSGQLLENGIGCKNTTQTPDGTTKVPSRTARRKKARRKWLREKKEAEKNEFVSSNMEVHEMQSPRKDGHEKDSHEMQSPRKDGHEKDSHEMQSPKKDGHEKDSHEMQSPKKDGHEKDSHEMQSPKKDGHEKDSHESSLQDLVPNQEADNEICEVAEADKIVPIVIRPGHIRFEPLEEGELFSNADRTVQQNKVYVETFQWNGITSKKKGQKWGTEKFPYRRNDCKESNEEVHSETITAEKVNPPIDPIDFDKLAPLTGSPKEGDVIAYRLLELSSTWTPEICSFRVGKTSWYDPGSGNILLTPVPEHPIVFEKLDEDACSEELPDNSLYREDGSLEIDFLSLLDVRIVKPSESHSAKALTSSVNSGFMANEASTSTAMPFENGKQTDAPTPAKEGDAWNEISQALSAKKEQLIRENGWNKEGSGKASWSYRALRGSALGPTMAILRARNDI